MRCNTIRHAPIPIRVGSEQRIESLNRKKESIGIGWDRKIIELESKLRGTVVEDKVDSFPIPTDADRFHFLVNDSKRIRVKNRDSIRLKPESVHL